MKKLPRLRYAPRWVSHLGCLIGCLDYLGLGVSDAWLYGATGYAFILNMHAVVCPSGPTAWRPTMLFDLGCNIGYVIDGVVGNGSQDGFSLLKERAWEHVRQSIDAGLPCYAWGLDLAEYYLIYGYDEVGYHFSGPSDDGPRRPKPWQELGDRGGVIEVYSVQPGQPADERHAVHAALSMVLQHGSGTTDWILPEYQSGLAGYELWIRALEDGRAVALGMAYNAAVWAECRGYAVQFLRQAGQRLSAHKLLFQKAARSYAVVARQLSAISERYPFSFDLGMGAVPVDECSRAAVRSLRLARRAEGVGLEILAEIVQALSH